MRKFLRWDKRIIQWLCWSWKPSLEKKTQTDLEYRNAHCPGLFQLVIIVLVYKALNGTGPEYICELLTVQEGVRDLRSVHNVVCLKEPRTKLVTGGDRSFEKAAACLWTCTPVSLRNTDSLKSFKSGLKRCLCAITYT